MIRRAWLRLRAVFGQRALEDEMQAEMREHLDRAAERLVARGLSPADARIEARREFGNTTVIQEDARDARGARWIAALAGDVRFAIRYFARNKLTVAIIVSVFALGIGANTALVTVLQSQFQRPAPAVPDEGQVWILGQQRATTTAQYRYRGFSYGELRDLAARRETFTHVAGWLAHDVILNAGDSIGPRGVRAHFVTPGFFPTLGVRVAAGMDFTATESEGADMSAVMSFGMAEQLYGTPASAIGQRILVNDVAVRVVGLAPPAFQGAQRHMDQPALWIPVSARADIARVPPRWLAESPALEAFGRLTPGVSEAQAAAIVQVVVARTLPDSAARVGMARTARVISLHAMLPGPETREAIMIFGLVGIVGVLLLLVTCTNVSSIMVAAAVARRHEIAVRLSLGASRARILRQLLTESTLLAVAGGMCALIVCWWLVLWLSRGQGTIEGQSVTPDLWTLAYTMGIAVATGLVFGLSPALHATRSEVARALQDSGTGASRRSRLQRGFVIAQIVLSQPLLITLGVTIATMFAEYKPPRPELTQRVTWVSFRPLSETGAAEHRREAVDSLIPRLVHHPEVVAVAPEPGWLDTRGFMTMADSIAAQDRMWTTLIVDGMAPGWFALREVPILLGRDVSLADTASRDWPVVIGSDLARRLWGGANPIGRTLTSPGTRNDPDSVRITVVGVFDATDPVTGGSELSRVFTAHGEAWRRDALLVRTRGSAEAFMPELRRLVREQAPGLPVSRMLTLAQIWDGRLSETVQISAILGAAGALALLLASLGLYGVIALAVRQRTREIGIRIALGARPVRVARMFLASGMRLGAVALLIGLPLSMMLLQLFLSQAELLAERVNGWLVGAVVAVALMAVAGAATWIPARRASLVDPVNALRSE